MIHYIVSGHGELSKALVASSFMIFPMEEGVSYIPFYEGETLDSLEVKYQDCLSQIEGKEVIFLVDLWGGTPFNVAAKLSASNPDIHVISGVNLMMLLEAYLHIEKDAKDVVEQLICVGKEAINNFVLPDIQEKEEDEL